MNPPGPSVLLAEDEDDARELLAAALADRGWSVRTCADGEEAIAALAGEPDVLVTDIVMPKADGIAVLRRAAAWPAIVKVVITSFADKDRVKAALNAGADHLVEKPFTGRRLDALLRDLLDRSRRRHEGTARALFSERVAALPLTSGEADLVSMVLRGMGNKQIGAELGVSEQSVKNRLHGMYQKLGINSRTELFHALFPI